MITILLQAYCDKIPQQFAHQMCRNRNIFWTIRKPIKTILRWHQLGDIHISPIKRRKVDDSYSKYGASYPTCSAGHAARGWDCGWRWLRRRRRRRRKRRQLQRNTWRTVHPNSVVLSLPYWKTYIFHRWAERGVQCFKWHERKDTESDRSRDMFQHAYQANYIENGEYHRSIIAHLVHFTPSVSRNARTAPPEGDFSLGDAICTRWINSTTPIEKWWCFLTRVEPIRDENVGSRVHGFCRVRKPRNFTTHGSRSTVPPPSALWWWRWCQTRAQGLLRVANFDVPTILGSFFPCIAH